MNESLRRATPGIALLCLLAAGCGGSGASTAPAAAPPATAASPEKPPAATVETSAPKPKGFSCAFDADAAGRLPAGFSFLTAGPITTAGVWKVEEVSGASSGRQVLSGTPKGDGEADRLAVFADEAPADGTFSTLLKGDAPGAQGGLLLRYQDASNYLAVLVDLDRGACSLIRVAAGTRTVAAKGSVPNAKKEGWRALTAECRGGSIRCLLDGTEVCAAKEKALSGGRAGLLVRGTAKILFDDFTVEAK